MAIPTYDQFIEPILRYLAKHPEGAAARDAHEAAADVLCITDADRLEMLPSGVQPIYKNRAGWAHDRLKRSGLSESPRKGYWKLTAKGIQLVKSHPKPLTAAEVEEIADSYDGTRLRPAQGTTSRSATAIDSVAVQTSTTSPDDRLEQALSELRRVTGEELLEAIGRSSPIFFERLVLDLLHAMGYGTNRADLQQVGRSGDGGIDGIISLDRLGLEKVLVQAKRWQQGSSVGREAIQAFYGALAGQRANKGVFLTTSSFSAQATEFARSVGTIVLIDGERLTNLLMDYGVGVSHRVLKVPKLDNDFFEE